jgi:hypothetical protein
MYPYLSFAPDEEVEGYRYDGIDEFDEEGYRNYLDDDDDDEFRPTFRLKNGQIAGGKDCAGEYHLYYIIPELNELGRNLFRSIKTLVDIKFIEIKDGDNGEFISIAPWHSRHV